MAKDEKKKEVLIYVNTREEYVEDKVLSYSEIAELAFPGTPQGGTICFTITYVKGHKPKGELLEGDEVKVKKGMEFNVTKTDKS